MTDRVEHLAFQDNRTDALYFCIGKPQCKQSDRERRSDKCPDCVKASRQLTSGAAAFRVRKPE